MEGNVLNKENAAKFLSGTEAKKFIKVGGTKMLDGEVFWKKSRPRVAEAADPEKAQKAVALAEKNSVEAMIDAKTTMLAHEAIKAVSNDMGGRVMEAAEKEILSGGLLKNKDLSKGR